MRQIEARDLNVIEIEAHRAVQGAYKIFGIERLHRSRCAHLEVEIAIPFDLIQAFNSVRLGYRLNFRQCGVWSMQLHVD